MKLPLTSLSVTTKDLDLLIISRVVERSILEKKVLRLLSNSQKCREINYIYLVLVVCKVVIFFSHRIALKSHC